MPTYEFRCRTCDTVFAEKRSMAESSAPATCPDGHTDTVRLLSTFASVGAAAEGGRSALPMAGGGGGCCGGGCGCAH